MGDTLTFTTKLSADMNTAKAAFTILSPFGAGFLPTSVGLTSANHREDKHRVMIVLYTTPDTAKLGSSLSRPSARVASQRPAPKGKDLSDQDVSDAEDRLGYQQQRTNDIELGAATKALQNLR